MWARRKGIASRVERVWRAANKRQQHRVETTSSARLGQSRTSLLSIYTMLPYLPSQADSQTGGVEGGGEAGQQGEDELDGGLQHDQPAQQPGELGSPEPAHPGLRR